MMRVWLKTDICAPLRCCIISQKGTIFVDALYVNGRKNRLLRVVRRILPYVAVIKREGIDGRAEGHERVEAERN